MAAVPRSETRRVAVLGAGPIGLEAALAARRAGFSVQVYERGRIAEHVHRWGHVRLFSPFHMNSTPAGRQAILDGFPSHAFPAPDQCLTGREHAAIYLEPLARTSLLKETIHTEAQVIQVGREKLLKEESPGGALRAGHPFRILLREKGKERIEEADIVFDCTGVYGQHRWMGEGGIPAPGELAAEPQICYVLDDILGDRKGHYAGKTTLVVGGGFSACTSVCALAELAQAHPESWVIWLARAAGTQPMKRIRDDPLRERDRLAARANQLATRTDANVEFHPQAQVRALESLGPDRGFKVAALVGKSMRAWDVDRIIANVGFTPDRDLYRELQVHECYASLGPMRLAAALLGSAAGDCLEQKPHGPQTLTNPEPNFFILGNKSYGRNSQFLLRIGFEQIQEVMSLLIRGG